MSPNPIETRDLTKRFASVVAVDRLDLTIQRGIVFGLLGPNGAGKTTTIRLLTGVARPTSGKALVDGVDMSSIGGLAARREIGVLDQEPRFYGWMTGRELLRFVGELVGLESADFDERINETIDRVGLTEASNRRISGYSSGMRQRLGIAQAILGRPEILVLDEPVSSLDPEGRRDLLALIRELGEGSTVVFSTHLLSDVERVCDRVAILDRGRLVVDAPIADLLARFAPAGYRIELEPGQDPHVHALVTGLAERSWVTGTEVVGETVRVGVTGDDSAATELLSLLASLQLRVLVFERQRATLEDVFLRLVGRDHDAAEDRQPQEVGRAASSAVSEAGSQPAAGVSAQPAGKTRVVTRYSALLKKEVGEAWRTYRLGAVAGLFLVLGVAAPILTRYLPDIVRALAPSGLVIEVPSVGVPDVLDQLLKNIVQFGALAAILVTMGSVANEKERGTAAFVLAKPVSRLSFLLAKVVVLAMVFAISIALAVAGAWVYTAVLFEPQPILAWVLLGIVVWLSTMVYVSITFLGSAVAPTSLAAAAVGFFGLIVLSLASIVPALTPYLPAGLTGVAKALALGQSSAELRPLLSISVATLVSVACFVLAWVRFRTEEL